MESLTLSIVIPVYRGEEYLDELAAELAALRGSLDEQGLPLVLCEAIFVDDGSVDDSSTALTRLSDQYPWIRVVTLSRNFGQHPATVAGILHSSGDWVATIDEDLQHHPKHILPMLLHAAEEECDVVYGKAEAAVHGTWFRDGTSRLIKRMICTLSGNENVLNFSSFRLIRGPLARATAAVSAHETYFDVAVTWFTKRASALRLKLTDPRGKDNEAASGYNLKSLLAHARRLVVTSNIKALRLGLVVGVMAMLTAVIGSVVMIVLKLAFPEMVEVRGWASLMVVMLFFGGLTSMLIGILLEHLSVVLLRIQGHPTYFAIDRSKDVLLKQLAKRHERLTAASESAVPDQAIAADQQAVSEAGTTC